MSSLRTDALRAVCNFELSRRYSRFLQALTIAVAISLLLLAATSGFDHYTPDSWSYVDIAQNMPYRPGVIKGVRSFSNEPWLNDSFPFLWPAILSLPMELTGAIFPLGMILNLLFVLPLTSATILFYFFPQGTRFIWAGVVTLLLCVIPGYMAEVLSGRSLPLSVLCLSAFLVAIRSQLTWPWIAFAAISLGLIGANRFDGFILSLAIAISASITHKLTWLKAFSLSLGALAGQVPWILYSLTEFGEVFVSSSASRILNPTHVSPDGYPIRSLQDRAPGLFESFLESLPRAALALAISLTPLALLMLISYLHRARATHQFRLRKGSTKREHSSFWLIGLIATAAEFVQVVFAGFSDHRYFMLAVLLFTFAFIEDQGFLAATTNSKRPFRVITALLAGSVLVVTGEALYKPYAIVSSLSSRAVACIANVPEPFIAEGPRAYKIAAMLGLKVVSQPSNSSDLNESDWRELSEKYAVYSWLKLDDLDLPVAADKNFNVYRCEN